jgi:UDP-3-O-[3-hydroxymyristoyl] glucosamine N-acyltransferase
MDQQINLGSLAALLGGKLSDPTKAGAVVRGFRALDAAGPSDLAFLWDSKYEAMAKGSRAAAIVARAPVEGATAPTIVVADPQAAMLVLLGQVYARRHPPEPPGVHPQAYVHPEARLARGGLGRAVRRRRGRGQGRRADADPRRGLRRPRGHDRRRLRDPPERHGPRPLRAREPGDHLDRRRHREGRLRLREQGRQATSACRRSAACASTTTSRSAPSPPSPRGALEDTHLRRGVKIDDHCHVAHNCDLGEDVMLVGYARMGGSVKLGKGSYLLQDAAVGQGRTVGEGGVVGSGAKARYDDVKPGERVLGDPARPHVLTKRIEGSLPKLPDMRRRLKSLERRVARPRRQEGQRASEE